jgi:hypothetical protein
MSGTIQGSRAWLSRPETEPVASDFGLPLVVVLAFAVADFFWASTSDLGFTGWRHVAIAAGVLCGAGGLCRAARRFSAYGEAAFYGAAWIAFGVLGCILTYATQRLGRPLWDTQLGWADALLGFDVWSWSAWIEEHAWARTALSTAYASQPLQVAVSVLALALLKRSGRNAHLLLSTAVALASITAIAAMMPAVGPFPHMASVPELFRLRGGGPLSVSVGTLTGVITFPSYRAALAALIVWAHRDVHETRAPILLINVATLIAMPSVGGHYVVDIFAGVAVAIVAAPLAGLLQPHLQAGGWRLYVFDPRELMAGRNKPSPQADTDSAPDEPLLVQPGVRPATDPRSARHPASP